MQVSSVSANRTNTLVRESFVEKMMLTLPTMRCSFKTNPAILCTHPEG